MSWLRSLGRYFSRAKLIGTDLEGNSYFEKVVHEAYKPRRSVKVKDIGQVDRYTSNTIPPEWDSWLRGLRDDPPTMEEMTRRVLQAKVMEKKIQEVEERERLLREQEMKDGLLSPGGSGTKAAGHASAPSFTASHASTDEPTSTGEDFQPASWKPPAKPNPGSDS